MTIKSSKTKGLPPLRAGLLMTNEQIEVMVSARCAEEFRRMEALAESLGIPEGAGRWYAVALNLARQHVPELKEAKPMGAPKKWGDVELGLLAVEIERELEVCRTQEQATSALARREPWKSFLQEKSGSYFGADPAAALLKVYSEAKKNKFTKVTRQSFKYHQLTDTIPEWEAYVQAIASGK